MVRHGSFSGRRSTIASVVAAAAVILTATPHADAAPVVTSIPIPTPDGTPVSIAAGPGGIWYTDPSSGVVGRVNADASITEFALADPAAGPTAIAAGPDGAMWFTQTAADAVGRITPVGDVTDFPLPAAGGGLAGVAAGSDRVWFTMREGNPLGSATVGGVTTYAIAGAPSGIATGPDGALWTTDGLANAIRRIDPLTFASTTFPLPIGASAGAITAGADGALWFTMRGLNAIGRLTTAGVLSSISLPDAAANPTAIAAGADGSIWVTETGVDKVVRLENGSFQSFAVGDRPRGVSVDATGAAWVAVSEGFITRIGEPAAAADETAPTITIASPATGAWSLLGSGGLVADYGCADETALALCEGTAADGAGVPDTALGSHVFSVHAEDAAGNTADASVPYLVFGSVEGSLATGGSSHGPWETLEFGMGLARGGGDPVSAAEMTAADCASGDPLGDPVATSIRTRVTPAGDLDVRWRPGSGTGCVTLTLWFDAPGWQGAPATFGPVPL